MSGLASVGQLTGGDITVSDYRGEYRVSGLWVAFQTGQGDNGFLISVAQLTLAGLYFPALRDQQVADHPVYTFVGVPPGDDTLTQPFNLIRRANTGQRVALTVGPVANIGLPIPEPSAGGTKPALAIHYDRPTSLAQSVFLRPDRLSAVQRLTRRLRLSR